MNPVGSTWLYQSSNLGETGSDASKFPSSIDGTLVSSHEASSGVDIASTCLYHIRDHASNSAYGATCAFCRVGMVEHSPLELMFWLSSCMCDVRKNVSRNMGEFPRNWLVRPEARGFMAEVLNRDFVQNIQLRSSRVVKKLSQISFFSSFAFENSSLKVVHLLLRSKR